MQQNSTKGDRIDRGPTSLILPSKFSLKTALYLVAPSTGNQELAILVEVMLCIVMFCGFGSSVILRKRINTAYVCYVLRFWQLQLIMYEIMNIENDQHVTVINKRINVIMKPSSAITSFFRNIILISRYNIIISFIGLTTISDI